VLHEETAQLNCSFVASLLLHFLYEHFNFYAPLGSSAASSASFASSTSSLSDASFSSSTIFFQTAVLSTSDAPSAPKSNISGSDLSGVCSTSSVGVAEAIEAKLTLVLGL
jgi:hypothetical protein